MNGASCDCDIGFAAWKKESLSARCETREGVFKRFSAEYSTHLSSGATHMANSKLLVVVGATGTQGGSVVETFLREPQWKIRGVTRNASSSQAKKLSARGVEMVEADLDDPRSLSAAFTGASVIYGVTDFWKPLSDPKLTQHKNPDQSLSRWAYEYELRQGKNLFDAAAKVDTLERFIFSSIADVAEHSEGKYTGAYHADTKAHAEKYGRQEHPELWRKTSTIQVGVYLSNFAELETEMPRKVCIPESISSLPLNESFRNQMDLSTSSINSLQTRLFR